MVMAQRISILSFFLDVSLHTTAERGIELREIADLHWGNASPDQARRARRSECFGLMQIVDRVWAGTRGVQLFFRGREGLGVQRSTFNVWRLAFGVWRLAFGVWRLEGGGRR